MAFKKHYMITYQGPGTVYAFEFVDVPNDAEAGKIAAARIKEDNLGELDWFGQSPDSPKGFTVSVEERDTVPRLMNEIKQLKAKLATYEAVK